MSNLTEYLRDTGQAPNDDESDAPDFSATQSLADDEVSIADFSQKRKPIFFTMDGERYDCRAVLAPIQLQKLAVVAREKIDVNNMTGVMHKIAGVFRVVLTRESAERFNARLLWGVDVDPDEVESNVEPLDLRQQVVPVMHWILEQYGIRPTQPSSSSSAGLPREIDGITSTAGASSVE